LHRDPRRRNRRPHRGDRRRLHFEDFAATDADVFASNAFSVSIS
jgi:hypothetical protein